MTAFSCEVYFDDYAEIFMLYTHTTHTTILLLFWNVSGTTRVSRYQKGKTRMVKTNLDLLEQEVVSGSGICWAICKLYDVTDTNGNVAVASISKHAKFVHLFGHCSMQCC